MQPNPKALPKPKVFSSVYLKKICLSFVQHFILFLAFQTFGDHFAEIQ